MSFTSKSSLSVPGISTLGIPSFFDTIAASTSKNVAAILSRGFASSSHPKVALSSPRIRYPLIVAATYILSEAMFYLYFHWHLIPQANKKRPSPDPYHDFPEVDERVHLCQRILDRLKVKAKHMQDRSEKEDDDSRSLQNCYKQVIKENFLQWFEYIPVDRDEYKTNSTTSGKTSPSLSSVQPTPDETFPVLERKDSNPASVSKPKEMLQFSFLGILRQRNRGLSTATETTSAESDRSINEASSDSSIEYLNRISNQMDDDLISNSLDSVVSEVPETWSIPGLHRRAMYDLLAWAFFAKDTSHLTDEEAKGVEKCLMCFQETTGLVGEDEEYSESSSIPCYKARRMSLEEVQAIHRPWLAYGMTAMSKFVKRRIILPSMGFKKVQASSVPLIAWFRPGSKESNDVCLFWHGIAPGGLLLYLPMIKGIFGDRRQSVILFENSSVSCEFNGFRFQALTEEETVVGVKEILEQSKISNDHCLTLMGHSYGSCPITWLLRRRNDPNFFRNYHFNHVVLLDPVTLLLSEPTVMTRFIYNRDNAKLLMVSSELFTEYYLRRNFCWYNAELWLEDFCRPQDDTKAFHHGVDKNNSSSSRNGTHDNNPHRWTIVLAGQDEIVPSSSVHDHVRWLKDQSAGLNCNVVYWPNAKHGHCIALPSFWKRIRSFLFPHPHTPTD